MDERELDLIELLYDIMKKWRSIIVVAILCCLAGGAFAFFNSTKQSPETDEAYQQQLTDYEAAFETYELEGEKVRETYSETLVKYILKKDYVNSSAKMRIDPYNEYIANVTFSVFAEDTDTEFDITKIVVDYLSDGALATCFSEKLIRDIPREYIPEVVSYSTSSVTPVFTIDVICASQKEAESAIKCITEIVADKSNALLTLYPNHEIKVANSSVNKAVNLDMASFKDKNMTELESLEDAVDDAEKQMDAYKENAPVEPVYQKPSLSKALIKYAVLAFIAGIVLMMFFWAVKFVFTKKVYGDDFYKAAKINLIGSIYLKTNEKKSIIDRAIDGIFRKNNRKSDADSIAMTAAAIDNCAGEEMQEVAVIGSFNSYEAKEIIESLSKVCNTKLVDAGDILTDPDNARKIKQGAGILMLVREYDTTVEQVVREKELVKLWNAKLMGAVTIR